MLSQYTDNEKEKRRLEELCSKQGMYVLIHFMVAWSRFIVYRCFRVYTFVY